MIPRRFDLLVVGAGPAGSTAALVLARAGASVALLDKAQFPSDKACGDLIGPPGLQVLTDLGIPVPPGFDIGNMVVVGPTGRRVVLPCFNGVTYPGRARAITRTVLDDPLRTAALEAGAVPYTGRADRPLESDGDIGGFVVGNGGEPRADFVIVADGAASHVAQSAGLVEGSRVLWGFCGALLRGPARRPPGNHAVGKEPVERIRRLRLGRCRYSPPISSTCLASDSSTGRPSRPCRGDWGDGSRWARSGPRLQLVVCCWWVTLPASSTPCRARESRRR